MRTGANVPPEPTPERVPYKLEPKMTTGELGDLLCAKYPRDRYALFFDVPDNVGLKANRRADAIAFGLWESVGHMVDGFELKVSRSDWLRELKQINKADPFVARCDRFWLITSSPAIAKLEEVPACWGWMAATKAGLRIQRPASRLPQPADGALQRMFVLGVLRRAQQDNMNPEEHRRALDTLRAEHEKNLEVRLAHKVAAESYRREEINRKVEKMEAMFGMQVTDWRFEEAARIARQLVEMNESGPALDRVENVLKGQQSTLRHMLECLELALGAVKRPT